MLYITIAAWQVDTGEDGKFGGETEARRAFEKFVRERGVTDGKRVLGRVETGKIPSVCVCIEGGEGTIKMMHQSAQDGMAMLCIKGSGRTADFVADLALVRFRRPR
jgi:hypothetical protein